MSEFVTDEVEEQIRAVRVAKHVVIKNILKDHLSSDTTEENINELLLRIYQLFYDSSMVEGLFSEIQERERQKQALQEMELEDIAKMAFGSSTGESVAQESEFAALMETDENTFNSMVSFSEQIPYEEEYNVLKEANIHIIVDFFSAFHGSTTSLWETTSGLSEIDKKNVLDIFSLFVEKQMETESEDNLGKDLGAALNIDVVENKYFIFMYAPKKWLDHGMTQRLSLGLMIREEWVKYISILSKHLANKLNEIAETILGTTLEDLANISFRLVDLENRRRIKTQTKEVAEFIARCSIAWEQIQSSTVF